VGLDEIAAATCGQNRLQRIAEAIGCSPANIHDGSGAARPMREASELLKLFLSIPSAEDRKAVLGFARQLAGEAVLPPLDAIAP